MKAQNYEKMCNAAKHFANANSSDPFALSRALAHIANGVASVADKEGRICYYDAEEYQETYTIDDGTDITITRYRNIIRP